MEARSGEESVLSVALQNPGCEVVIDDLQAGDVLSHGISLLGSAGPREIGEIVEARL